MRARKLLIVDGNNNTREKMANYFEDSYYDVETTPSAAYAIAKLVQGNKPLVIVGDSFEEIISAQDVIALMRRANKDLKIILVSDNSSLEALTKIHQEGILFHSLKPTNQTDINELLEVVAYAI